MICYVSIVVFFFKQKTAYEMRISDWSSDVCSSDLQGRYVEVVPFKAERLGELADKVLTSPYGDGYSFTTSNEWVQMQTGGEHVGACLQRHLEAGERCAGAGLAAAQVLAAKERGVEMRTSTEVIELVKIGRER